MAKSKSDLLVENFNEKYAFVLEDTKPKIYIKSYDEELERDYYNSISTETLRLMYENTEMLVFNKNLGKEVAVTHADIWLKSPKRNQYLEGVVFDPNPNRKSNRNVLNLWQGYSVPPKEGNWDVVRDHLFNIICGKDETLFNYVMGWLARKFQKPHLQGEVALILRGKKGSGKGQFLHFIRNIFGNHGLHITNGSHLTGKFNDHLRNCAFLFVDEAFFAADKEHEKVLKGLITDDTITIEKKHGDVTNKRNRLAIAMATNERWVAPASSDERRYCVTDVSDAAIGDRPYMTALRKAVMNPDVQAAFLYEMLNYDLSEFELRNIPETAALSDQRLQSLDSIGRWWFECLMRGQVYQSKYFLEDFNQWHEIVSTDLLYESYLQYCSRMKLGTYSMQTRDDMGSFLSKMYNKGRTVKLVLLGEIPPAGGLGAEPKYSTSAKRVYVYQLNVLEHARAKFKEVTKINYEFESSFPHLLPIYDDDE